MSRIVTLALATILVFATSPSLFAQSAEQLAQSYFYTTDRAERDTIRQKIITAAETDPAARFVHATAILLGGIEQATIALSRHGFQSPAVGPLSNILGLPTTPIDPTGQYDPIDYQTLRNILEDFDNALAAAGETLAAIPADTDFEITLDLTRATIDLGDETLSSNAIVGGVVPDAKASQNPERNLTFVLDRADAYWLEGYSHVLRATTEFILAHDFERSFDMSFSIFFPKSMPPSALNAPVQNRPQGPMGFTNFDESRQIADLISFIHLFDLPVIAPERRKAVRTHLLEMIRLSRETWKVINAETDDNKEWLPGPHQSGSHPIVSDPVTEAQVAAWHTTLNTFEAILNGDLLVPHWRFPDHGINIKSFLEDTANLDIVLMLTGPAFVPYLEKGNVLDPDEFAAGADAFGPLGFIGTAFWFN